MAPEFIWGQAQGSQDSSSVLDTTHSDNGHELQSEAPLKGKEIEPPMAAEPLSLCVSTLS